ncbi:MAG: PH domain-containing protein [Patescibacteria group bacterium]
MSYLKHPLPHTNKQAGQLFPGQFPDEKLIFLIRRHWSLIIKYILRLLVAHIIAVGIFIFLVYFLQWELPNSGPIYVILIMIASCYFLGAWLLYLHEFVDYHLDIWILTDRRILNIEQEGLFKRTASELDITKIQDVTAEINGKVQTFLNFGNVYVQTAAESQRFVFEEVARPQEVARKIIDTVEQATRSSVHYQAQTIHQKFHDTSSSIKE